MLRGILTHSHSERPKRPDDFAYISNKSIFKKIFEGEILIKNKITTLCQIFWEFSFYSQVIIKSMEVADDTF